MSRSAGTGSPIYFRCPKARRERNMKLSEAHERVYEIELTGRTRPYKPSGSLGLRSTFISIEYKCQCGYRGWSNHIELARRAKREGLIGEIDR